MNITAGEEAGPKLVRLLYFVGTGFLCTAAINKWRDLEKKANIAEKQQTRGQFLENPSSSSNVVPKALDYRIGFI